jgi:hypothetical protein
MDEVIQYEESHQHARYGRGVIDVDRAQKVALLALKCEPARQTLGLHPEQSLKHLRSSTSGAAQT